MNNVLEVTGLNKDFGGFKLKDISFTLQEGCITGFIGINGAGKTTTIKTILGLILKNSGCVKLFGQEITGNDEALKNRIGVVLDDGYFYDELTIEEMRRVIAPAFKNWDEAEYRRYISRFGLNPRQKIATLSKGMRMKYAISLALSHHADLLIMDEPTSGLDPLIRNELLDILLEFMQQEGKTVFFSTHITSDLDKIADTLILIDKGDILFSKEKDALLDTHGLVKGDKKDLNEGTRRLFLRLRETEYGFEGITNEKAAVKAQMKALVERPTIEEIMLAYIGGNRR